MGMSIEIRRSDRLFVLTGQLSGDSSFGGFLCDPGDRLLVLIDFAGIVEPVRDALSLLLARYYFECAQSTRNFRLSDTTSISRDDLGGYPRSFPVLSAFFVRCQAPHQEHR